MNVLWRELSIAWHAGDRRREGETLIGLSKMFRARGNTPGDAVSAGREAVTIFRELGDRRNESAALVAFGGALSDKKQTGEAVRVLGQAVAISREAGDQRGEASALCELSRSLIDLNRIREAAEAVERAAAIFHETGDRRAECRALGDLGYCHLEMGQAAASVEAGRRAVALARETGLLTIEAGLLLNLGRALLGVKLFEEAVAVSQQAVMSISKLDSVRTVPIGDDHRQPEPRRLGMALSTLGCAFLELEQYPESIEASRQALAILDEAGVSSYRAETLTHLASALGNTGRYEEALDT
ncbi:MAG: hypothetical protein ACRDQY_19625 [Pseudonocardiaceae bacterium]